MRAGNFNINEYLERLFENSESGNIQQKDQEGIIIPDENKKAYDWLKREYNKGKTEVKVEISGNGASFKPGYDLQTKIDSVKEFKPGVFGDIKANDTTEKKDENPKPALDSQKEKESFQPKEGETIKKELPKTSDKKEDIKDKESKEDEEKSEKEEKPEVRKIDLKTKRNDKR